MTLFELLDLLEEKRIFFKLGRYRKGVVTVAITVPGERIELDVSADGNVEISRFRDEESGAAGEGEVRSLLEEFGD